MAYAKHKALEKAMGHVNLPHVGMGGKYKGMEFVRGARGRATYLGMKRTKLHEEKQPTSFAKSIRRHEEK